MKISNFMVTLIAASGLFLATPGWSKKPVSVPDSELPPISQKESMCHKGRHIIDISVSALHAHEAHGDWVVEDTFPCPADSETLPSLCLDTNNQDFDVDALNHVLADLLGPLFDIQEGLLYLPQVKLDILGVIQTFAVILERFSDTDFVVRHVEFLAEPSDLVAFVEFDGISTVVPFDVEVVADDPELVVIYDVEFTVLEGCRPVQVSVTNFLIPQDTVNP